jgi:serine phosphatase RsbU (regulator of sigma subunit)/anti-sigma regulatory factor (Ser/Thr protein kinase)
VRQARGHLRSRLIVWSFVPALLVLATVATFTFVAYEQLVQGEVVDREREGAYIAANRLKEELDNFSEVLDAVARTEATFPDNPEGQRATLSDAQRRLSIFDGGVVLLDNFGRVVDSQPARPEIVGQDWSDRLYFRLLLGGEDVVFSDTVADGPGEAPVVVLAVPIASARGEFLGSLAGMFRLGEPTISALYASLVRLRAGESVYLIDSAGQIIYHPDPERIGEGLAGTPAVEGALAGQAGAYRVSERGERDRVVAFAPVPDTPWALITEEDWAALTSVTRRYERLLLVLLVLGILLPAIWFGLLARERRAEAVERAILDHQLQVARLIQQTLLPKDAPILPGWHLSSHYEPAQAVGGDFYDFLQLEDGRLGLVIGDVTDKGVPAALVMSTTRSLLRTIAQPARSPGAVLQQVNDLLHKEIPPKMFVTCLYAILDPATGRLHYANAGHNLPYRFQPQNGALGELRARGMPLGLMPNMVYEEQETTIAPGECLVFFSDGLVEAHSPQREMFGNSRIQNVLRASAGDGAILIQRILGELDAFTGRGWQQEDDVTLVTLQRDGRSDTAAKAASWHMLAEFTLPSEPGNERQAMREVVDAVQPLEVPPARLERLKTAVAEATMNALEHGNRYQADLQVVIQVFSSDKAIMVRVIDQGRGPPISEPEPPNLEAKLAGRQAPRGWGLFLIENMVDQMQTVEVEGRHALELLWMRKGDGDGQRAV